jgi:trichohyalin
MWLMWIVSLLILTAAILFSLYIFYGSHKVWPLKNNPDLSNDTGVVKKYLPATKQQVISSLKLKLHSVEQSSMLYHEELKKLQQRIQVLEKNKEPGNTKNKKTEDDENWEELYYNIHDAKEKMESELDLTNQKLEETEGLLEELKRRESVWKEKRSSMENELNKVSALQNKIEELKHQLEGASVREQELHQQLITQQELYKDYELIKQQYSYIQSEADELRIRIKEINNRDILLQQKINRLTELESNMEISEYEKKDIRKNIEEIIMENEALVAKLKDLQDKLNSENYA